MAQVIYSRDSQLDLVFTLDFMWRPNILPKLNFNGFILLAANNLLHKIHCGQHKPWLCCKWTHVLFVANEGDVFWVIFSFIRALLFTVW